MEILFAKYHGTGNDFIMLDGIRHPELQALNAACIARLCHRRYGIGADGLIVLQAQAEHDFTMQYYNADGHPGSMCGNGGRCAVFFARQQGYIGTHCRFLASDGLHEATILHENNAESLVKLSLNTSGELADLGNDQYFINTGSPHFLRIVNDLSRIDALQEGRLIRYSEPYHAEGVNVNFVELGKDYVKLCTYERGVEDLTYSCGTGVTAAAIVASRIGGYAWPVSVVTTGGTLEVEHTADQYYLIGQACHVFSGKLNL